MEEEKLVAVISPWDKLSEVIKHRFRVESLPAEKKVLVWRADLQDAGSLEAELKKIGVKTVEVRKKKVKVEWRDA